MNRTRWIGVVLLVCMLFTTTALAEVVTPRADLYFINATAFLTTDKRVSFDCTTYDIHEQISITDVWLEQQINGHWVLVRKMDAPTYVAVNTISYVAVADYSFEIGTGNVRVAFRVNADGYSIIRYSNSRTF